MKEELFDELREDYYEKLEKNERNKKTIEILKERRDYLVNDPKIKQYLDLEKDIKKYRNLVFKDRELMDSTLSYFDEVTNDEETNDIYLYLGSFVYDGDGLVYQVERGSERPDYNLYGNIETKQFLVIDYEDCNAFETDNPVIIDNAFPDENSFYDMRNEYFKEAFETDQEKAFQKFLKRTR